MSVHPYKALVVDDDPIVCQIVGRSLSLEGFRCAYAYDGDEALQCVLREPVDLVVTDLAMPKKNGHALAMELLALESPPFIVVHSCVDDPQLARDLMRRGVDDIIYKPTNYEAFAAKVAALVQRRRNEAENPSLQGKVRTSRLQDQAAVDASRPRPEGQEPAAPSRSYNLTDSPYDRRLKDLEQLIALPSVGHETFTLANRTDATIAKLARTLSADAALAAGLLRAANGSHAGGVDPTADLEQAVSRVGLKPAGDMALSMSALGTFQDSRMPWLDAELERSRSIAARFALDHLCRGRRRQMDDRLALCALLHPLGRLIQRTVFRDEYLELDPVCTEPPLPLAKLEQELFPDGPSASLERLFAQWNVSEEVWKPLRYIAESYESVASLADDIRDRVEILKLAIFIGNIAVGDWMSSDQVDPPPAEMLARHHIIDLLRAIEATRAAIEQASESAASSVDSTRFNRSRRPQPPRARIAYSNLKGACSDWMPELFASLNIETVAFNQNNHRDGQSVLVNCLNLPAAMVPGSMHNPVVKNPFASFLIRNVGLHDLPEGSPVVDLLGSVASFQSTCQRLAVPETASPCLAGARAGR